MLRPKKKITKKQLKEDALISSYVKARTFYEENKKNISIGVTVIAVLAVATVFYINNERANNERATTELGKVYGLYDSGQYQQAIDGVPERNIAGLKSIVSNYGGTKAGNMARFYLADTYYQLGRYEDALPEFEAFSPNEPTLGVSRLAGIAECYEAQGKYADAAEHYDRAASKYPNDVTVAENLSDAARNYVLAGQKERALELYKRLRKNYPTTPYGREADRYIAQLSA